MSGAVVIVKRFIPQRCAAGVIERNAGAAVKEPRRRQMKMSAQNQRVMVFLFVA